MSGAVEIVGFEMTPELAAALNAYWVAVRTTEAKRAAADVAFTAHMGCTVAVTEAEVAERDARNEFQRLLREAQA